MQQPVPAKSDLPHEPSFLGLELNFPLSCLSSIQNGYEAQDQEDKWSIYYRRPWIQIWRPTAEGIYCYAIRFEQTSFQCIRIAESWVGSQILDSNRGFGPNLEQHRHTVTGLLDFVARFSGERFEHGSLSGIRGRKKVTFSGDATSLEDVDKIAKQLRTEVTQMMKDGW
ncbi:MAG: hypothetical protein WBJ19_08980 [Rhodoferax sp.]